MRKATTLSAALLITALLVSGCSNDDLTKDSPYVSTAQGLGEQKVEENLFENSQFSEIYQSTKGTISFVELDAMEWEVKRLLKAPEGEKLPKGDNFRATAPGNISYNEVVINWAEKLKIEDGWEAEHEVKQTPPEDENELWTPDDYRMAQPYEIDLVKGETTLKVRINPDTDTITLNVNSR